jgi:serpin B
MTMKPTRLALTLLALSLGLTVIACDGASRSAPNPNPPAGDEVKSQKQRDTAPTVSPADVQALVAGNTAFAFDLYQQLRPGQSGNFFYSPMSLSEALAMTYAGARTTTATEMANVLQFTLPQDQLHPAFDALDLALASRGQGAKGADGQGFRLHIVNALWGQTGYGFLDPFLDTLAVNYDAGLRLLDFQTDPDAARGVINAWVASETENKILNLLVPGNVTSDTRLVLTNAIYFNAAWKSVFPTANTQDGSFTLLDGSTVTASLMTNSDLFGYAAGDGWVAADLPYDGDQLAMTVIVPDAGNFATFEAALDGDQLTAITGALTPQEFSVTLPKWTVDTRFSAKDQLVALGMADAFDPTRADFTGMNGGIEPLWIGDVIHQAHVMVNEYGTEAAAATAVVMAGGAMPSQLAVRADRPFIYVIRDLPTGTILFVGRVVNPLG